MGKYKGYLINATQASNYFRWMLNNPLRNHFKYQNDELNKNTKQITHMINYCRKHPTKLFFANELFMENTFDYTDTYENTIIFNNGLKDNLGRTAKEYINDLKKQKLINCPAIKKMVAKHLRKYNQKVSKKNNAKIKSILNYNQKINQKIRDAAKIYKNIPSGYTKLKPKILSNHKDYSAINIQNNLYFKKPINQSIMPVRLLKLSTKNNSKRKKFNEGLLHLIIHMSPVKVKKFCEINLRKKKRCYKINMIGIHNITLTTKKLDIFEYTALLYSEKYQKPSFSHTPVNIKKRIKMIPKQPAFKIDILHSFKYQFFDNSFSNPYKINDYLTLKKKYII